MSPECTPGPGDFRGLYLGTLIEPFSEEWQVLTHVVSCLSGKKAKIRHRVSDLRGDTEDRQDQEELVSAHTHTPPPAWQLRLAQSRP